MKFSVLTLFPQLIQSYCGASIIGRGCEQGVISVETVNPRDFTDDPHHRVDDSPYGGGSGMVLMCPPWMDAYRSLEPLPESTRVLMTTPTGRTWDHHYAKELSTCEQLVIFCGHYEGFDARITQLIPEIEEVSMGDYVLTGGELPALCMIDSISRLLPGVVQKFSSVEADSFFDGLLDHPHYTRPAEYEGLSVPDVLLSGNHAQIDAWRRVQSLYTTWYNRKDLIAQTTLEKTDRQWIERFEAGEKPPQ